MKFTKGEIEGLWVIEPKVFGDHRGYFMESFQRDRFTAETGQDIQFVQDNESLSSKGVLRGMHFQKPPHAQGKLVRVISGAVLDVAVDIRKDSPTYGKHQSILLSGENKTQFYIPPGFAHGFLTLEDNTLFSYKCTNFYHPESEGSLAWFDKDLAIEWGDIAPVISEKDRDADAFASFVSPF
ncbi:dTDP-4-dehydrorhamnose 3,5-epimerase [Lishizhenia tianjinensis]|uniref:dTDP-4-dehydrorhamnose 3,5-epimerase n=1 Tax=Lishizhenia tianjinensis TaxID=477690 RepID=A0A1I7BMB3_9FLAO|nr:dTDP-4-dehydrorhamnose 3,5-epimerase [Lishizhenia tianjinensis]SFT88317.1 dTDP-4-dehydrorhamnose 3,5-epimerase [Lishizhenia tianjinensis]